MGRAIIVVTLVLFGALTAVAVWVDGVTGIFASILGSYGSMQIFADLVISLTLIMIWMWRDARLKGRNPWPWIVATVLIGAFSPLVYLLTRNSTDS